MTPSPVAGDRFAAAGAVADAVLYEGYVLYPYRASAAKNRMRWQFGVLAPPDSVAADPSERSSCRTECLIAPDTDGARTGGEPAPLRLAVRVRCLHLRLRSVEPLGHVEVLDLLDEPLIPWDETVEQAIDVDLPPLGRGRVTSRRERFRFAPLDEREILHSPDGEAIARLVRRRQAVEGELAVLVEEAGDGLLKATVEVANRTPWPEAAGSSRQDMLRRSLVATHTMLAVDGGRFVSLLDPPPDLVDAAAACRSDGTRPVLVGADDRLVLSSPITLYDHPAVADESPGDLYDATEIDEILALRVLTLTDEEKAEARATDPRAAAVIDRVDAMGPEHWDRLHGTVRPTGPRVAGAPGPKLPVQAVADIPWWEPAADAAVDPFHDSLLVAGVELRRGSKVRLHPNRRADAQDLFLTGEVATVAAIVHDVDGGRHVAVTLDADPAAELHREQGRFLYFSPDEVEPLPGTNGSGSSGPGGGADGARPLPRRVLVAGIGNVFLGDDGFGVEVARRLAGRPLPEGVQAADFGIRGIHLAYEMLEGYDALVLIDAMPLDEAPGTLAVVEPDAVAPPAAAPRPVLDAHTMHPGVVLDLLEMLDVHVERIVVIGCQPLTFDGMGLSPPVAAAVDPAVDLLEGVLADVCDPATEAPA